jgi:GAF domain-containing protein
MRIGEEEASLVTAEPCDAPHEQDRLEALRRTGLLDSPPEPAFDRLTRLAARLLHAPVALVSLLDRDRQFFKSSFGLPEPWASRRETPLSHSFCRHEVASGRPLVVADARRHRLVRDNPAVAELGVVAYLGIPLIAADGHVLGSLCAIDHEPRAWTEDDVQTLGDLAASVVTEIELRTAVAGLEGRVRERTAELTGVVAQLQAEIAERKRLEEVMQQDEARFLALLDHTPAIICLKDIQGRYHLVNRRLKETFPSLCGQMLGRTDHESSHLSWPMGSGTVTARCSRPGLPWSSRRPYPTGRGPACSSH